MSLFPSVCPSVRCAPYLRNRTSSNHNFWYTCVKWWYLQAFFIFFQILIFWTVKGVKGQKKAQNKKQLHPSCVISQKQYSIWSWFLVQLCILMIYLGFSFVRNFHFSGCYGGKWAKNSLKWKIAITSVTCHISGTV